MSLELISPYQFGFLPQQSTVSALLFSTHSILSLLESNPSVCGVFLDLKKAFDSVPHQPFLDLLASHNLPPHLLNWIHSYLLDRSQAAVVNGSTSPSLPVSSGVPQGSILGPLLFLIYINGVTDIPLSISSQLTLYADDIFIFRPISSPSDMSLLQRDLDSISSWLTSHLLQLNSSKSKYIIFPRKSPSLFDGFPSLEISSSSIERVSSFWYLGVLLTPTLSWTQHISAICCKSRRILGIIFRHFHPYSSASTIIRLYVSLVRPHLEYCSAIWAPSSPSLCHSIESVQNFALKLASKFRPSLKSSFQSSFNLPNLSTRRLHSNLILIFKIHHNLLHFPLNVLQPTPPPPYPIRSFHPSNFLVPFSKSSSFFNSFFPSSISLWSSLPPVAKETHSLSLLKTLISKTYL